MATMTQAQVLAHQAKFNKPSAESLGEAVDREDKLRDQIIGWCKSKWPQWIPVWARSDKKSTLPVGCQDITLFAPKRVCYCLELKSKTSKHSKEQLAWYAQMRMLDWEVHTVRNWEDFIRIVK